MPLLFATTLFVSAALLFWVQPLIAKLLLPLLGGTPAVWTTCMLFFQGVLLAGYAYALALTRRLAPRTQAAVHVALLAAAAFALPFGVTQEAARSTPAQEDPTAWLLWTLAASVGLPFFALSASAPLFQKWFSETRHASAKDPYFLYAASNAGSLFALVAFPLLFEPFVRLDAQRRAWACGYFALVVLTFACALAARRYGAARGAVETTDDGHDDGRHVTWRRRLLWVALAFVPSSLVLGVTTYVTTDVAAVPLLWVVPLALYLLTFILAFARTRRPAWRRLASLVLPGAAIVLTLVYLSGATEPAWFLVLIHLAFFFVAAFVCHARLADDRPSARHLAEFYLWLSVGGVAGGIFNAVVAPLIFDRVVEYPLAVLLACLLRAPLAGARRDDEDAQGVGVGGRLLRGLGLNLRESRTESRLSDAWRTSDDAQGGGAMTADVTGISAGADDADEKDEAGGRRARALDFVLPVAVGCGVAALTYLCERFDIGGVERLALSLGVPLVVVNHFFTRRPARFALALGAVMLASVAFGEWGASTLHRERNFFGTLRVSYDAGNDTRRLAHGSTIHGRQFAAAARRCEPLSYYHRLGPLGSVFDAAHSRGDAPLRRVAAVGLGTGTSVAYSRAGEQWTFYEINPAVVRIARDPRFFTYLSDCAAGQVEVVLGDARLRLGDAPEGAYDLILLDAFSSDAIPASLLTREALAVYLSKLNAGGLVLFHTSNRGLDLSAVVGGLARDAGLAAVIMDDSEYLHDIGKEPSQWVAVARRAEDLSALRGDARWLPLEEHPARRFVLWTDDFSDIVSVFKIK
ncbi:MAG TPA: hypothetical protein VER32_13650 [Pyrinomonadaceae bacterium]|nr:hypothetical protein [Pyrinomonadaceae bacterium]